MKQKFKQYPYTIHFDLLYLAGRATEFISHPLGFNLVFLFLRITVLELSFPTSVPGHRLQVTQATILMPRPSGQCFLRCWVTGYAHIQLENKTDIFC